MYSQVDPRDAIVSTRVLDVLLIRRREIGHVHTHRPSSEDASIACQDGIGPCLLENITKKCEVDFCDNDIL